jgi:hypothetical protein
MKSVENRRKRTEIDEISKKLSLFYENSCFRQKTDKKRKLGTEIVINCFYHHCITI